MCKFVEGYEESYQGDDQGHGTFVSGIISASANNEKGITGVAGDANVSILPVKVMNKSGVGERTRSNRQSNKENECGFR